MEGDVGRHVYVAVNGGKCETCARMVPSLLAVARLDAGLRHGHWTTSASTMACGSAVASRVTACHLGSILLTVASNTDYASKATRDYQSEQQQNFVEKISVSDTHILVRNGRCIGIRAQTSPK